MSLIVAEGNKSSSEFVDVPVGLHLARCYEIIDLGTQAGEWQGQPKLQRKVMFKWEVHSEDESGNPTVTKKGEPMSISKNYTLSLSENARLRMNLRSWRGREFTQEELNGFDIKNVLGAWCMLSIIRAAGKNGKEYTNVDNTMPVPLSLKKAGLPEGHNPLRLFTLDKPDLSVYESFSDYIKGLINKSPEWGKVNGNMKAEFEFNKPLSGKDIADEKDDIPF
jgi:hypothetical protein